MKYSSSLMYSIATCVAWGMLWIGADKGTLCGQELALSVKTETSPLSEGNTADRRDVILLLDSGALHLRLNLALEGASLLKSREAYAQRLWKSLDKDGNGIVTKEEGSDSPVLRTKPRPNAAAFIKSLDVPQNVSLRDVQQAINRIGGEVIAFRQDLNSAQNDLAVFRLLDRDRSGTVENNEMEGVQEWLFVKDTDGDECVTFEECFPPPVPVRSQFTSASLMAEGPPVIASVADIIRDAQEPLLPARLIKKYDTNRDSQLSAKELGWSEQKLSECDSDRNGLLESSELKQLAKGTPELELAIDLRLAQQQGGSLQIKQTTAARLDEAGSTDFAKLSFGHSVVTVSLRNSDPIATSIDNAMRQFNLLDTDGNGYLDKTEGTLSLRFERELFSLVDKDEDGKIFVEEMQSYVQGRSEPSLTACRMNLYDTGSGFFMALDGNADGRISLREMQRASVALSQLERDGMPGIQEKEPLHHFHVEFVRASYQLFGASEQLVSQTPAFQQRRLAGPVWFQRMDRNNDGDLSWNEFLGPRQAFHELDTNADSLVDAQEASLAPNPLSFPQRSTLFLLSV